MRLTSFSFASRVSRVALVALAGCSDGGSPVASAAGASGQGGSPGADAGAAGSGSAVGGAGPSGASGQAGTAAQAGNSGPGGGAGSLDDPCALWPQPADGEPGSRLPPLAVSAPGDGLTTLDGLRVSCERPGLLVVRIEPAWCEPCGVRDDRMAELLAPLPADSVEVVTLLYAGRDNARPVDDDVLRWRQAHPSLPGRLLRATDGAAAELVRRSHTVPLVLLVDRRTLRVVSVLESPSESFLASQLRDALVEAGGPAVAPASDDPERVDGLFDPGEWAMVKPLGAPLILPPSPSNAYADDSAAADLGAQLFADPSLAGSNVACATCHRADRGLADGRPVAQGVSVGTIHTPAIATAAWSRWQFWDGRADTLWSQALGPLENPAEMNGSRLQVAHAIGQKYAAAYEAIFGPLPPLAEAQRFPSTGKPGEAAYDSMSAADRGAIDRVFVNVGKALEAHERTLRPPPTRLEAYVAGQFEVLTEREREGLALFLHAGCLSCHHGPTLSDGAFHNILMPSHAPTGPGDRGRIDGVSQLLASPFRADGPFSDDPTAGAGLAALVAGNERLGQQKTPSLRGVSRTGPWGHGGTFATLDDVVAHYGQGKVAELSGPRVVGTQDPVVASFAASHNAPLVAFLRVLGGD